MKIQDWVNENIPDELLYANGAFWDQLYFVRDKLVYLIGGSLKSFEELEEIGSVISTHTSKSVTLPVYQLHRKDLGIKIILRDNFHDWKVSIISDNPIDVNLDGLCHTTSPIDPDYTGDPLHPVYFEGFPEDLVFDYYDDSDKKKFSMSLHSDESLYTTLFLILRSIGAIHPLKWNTRKK